MVFFILAYKYVTMRYASITFLLLIFAFPLIAQELSPKILALNRPTTIGDQFNTEIANIAYGYRMALVDKSIPKTVRYVYKSENNETLRVDYRYEIESGKQPKVVYQKISGESIIMARIYNFLFEAGMTTNDMGHYIVNGADIKYRGNTYRFSFEEDDYAPGYWMMTFF
jgi:hypothetical protein